MYAWRLLLQRKALRRVNTLHRQRQSFESTSWRRRNLLEVSYVVHAIGNVSSVEYLRLIVFYRGDVDKRWYWLSYAYVSWRICEYIAFTRIVCHCFLIYRFAYLPVVNKRLLYPFHVSISRFSVNYVIYSIDKVVLLGSQIWPRFSSSLTVNCVSRSHFLIKLIK